jgi:hypothetical protein
MAVVWQLGKKPKETITGVLPITGRAYESLLDEEEGDLAVKQF